LNGIIFNLKGRDAKKLELYLNIQALRSERSIKLRLEITAIYYDTWQIINVKFLMLNLKVHKVTTTPSRGKRTDKTVLVQTQRVPGS